MNKVLSRKPAEYLVQGLTGCGAYSTKAVLEAYGKADKKDPLDYCSNWFAKQIGLTFSPNYWPSVLRKYGLQQAIAESADELSSQERIKLLKSLLDKNTPVMLFISNGYNQESGEYSELQAIYMSHWITLWGYDNDKQIFYVYDSAVPKQRYDNTLPIGNITRTYQQIINDWKTTLTAKLLGYPNQLYIKLTS